MATQVAGRQIKDGAINNDKVAAGAGIETSKLAEGADFLQRDGSVVMTGVLDFNNQQAANVPTPLSDGAIANKSYVDGQISSLNSIFKPKPNTRARTTVNINTAAPGTAIFDGVTLISGEYLMVADQAAPAQNGIYRFNGSGSALTRISQMDAWVEIPGATVVVEEGTIYADSFWLCTSNTGGTLNTTAITWQRIPTTSGGLSESNFVDQETVGGTINGVNTAFTLANTPISTASVHLYCNGILMRSGASNDYTISGSSITMLTAPISGDFLCATYRKA
jgi:hypothetical protein